MTLTEVNRYEASSGKILRSTSKPESKSKGKTTGTCFMKHLELRATATGNINRIAMRGILYNEDSVTSFSKSSEYALDNVNDLRDWASRKIEATQSISLE